MGHLLLILEYGASMLPLTLQPMQSMYIYTTDFGPKQIIQKYSVLEMMQTQPNMTFLKNILQCFLIGETIFTPLSVTNCFSQGL